MSLIELGRHVYLEVFNEFEECDSLPFNCVFSKKSLMNWKLGTYLPHVALKIWNSRSICMLLGWSSVAIFSQWAWVPLQWQKSTLSTFVCQMRDNHRSTKSVSTLQSTSCVIAPVSEAIAHWTLDQYRFYSNRSFAISGMIINF